MAYNQLRYHPSIIMYIVGEAEAWCIYILTAHVDPTSDATQSQVWHPSESFLYTYPSLQGTHPSKGQVVSVPELPIYANKMRKNFLECAVVQETSLTQEYKHAVARI